ncbi:hypothetical protein PLESTB_001020600 [Pleodorina starrii]|uniref:Uncharacterized protein n=1 Tax=Pleodorina starrii TaxID=330485 RepID=A0A9W6F4Q3_9CHLO|nr:hypothetical protein PLESTB_001020600 [Pleodorina starrii]
MLLMHRSWTVRKPLHPRRTAETGRRTSLRVKCTTSPTPPSAAPHEGASPDAATDPTAPSAIPAASAAATVASPPSIADLDARRFKLHPSCSRWLHQPYRLTTAVSNHQDGPRMPGPSLSDAVRQVVPPNPLAEPRRAAHWWYHLGRQVFFLTQSFGGFAAHHVSEMAGAASRGGGGGGGGGGARAGAARRPTPLERLLEDAEPEVASRLIDGQAMVEQDYDNIRAGYYPMPWDMVTPGHRQYNPLFALRGSLGFLREWTAITQRRISGQPEPLWISGSAIYPQYYTKTYHYQTDGWMSERSAALYEFATETLFTGLQDAMQRTSLLPLTEYLREAELGGRSVSELRLLEVAAGTGRFHTFIKDAHPALPTVVSDLSPFYLARARSNMRYWAEMRQSGRQLGGVDGAGVQQYLQTAAERINAQDDSFDIVGDYRRAGRGAGGESTAEPGALRFVVPRLVCRDAVLNPPVIVTR